MTEKTVNLLPLVHRQDIPTPEALLEAALPDVIAAIPDATCAQVYRLARGGMVVWYSVDGDAVPGRFYPMEEGSPYQLSAQNGIATIDDRYNLLIAPLGGRHGTIFGLLTIECSQPQTDATRLDAIAAQLSSALYSKQLEQLFQRQVTFTSEFNQAETLEQVAGIFAKNAIVQGQYIAINVFDYATDNSLKGATAIVTANRNNTYVVNDPIDMQHTFIAQVHESLIENGDFLISDMEVDSHFNADERAWLKSRHIHSAYCLPLYIGKQLYGFISTIDTTNALAPTPLEKQILQNIADQAASVIEKQAQTTQLQQIAEFSQTLQAALQLPEILNTMLRYAPRVVACDYVAVMIYDRNLDSLRMSARFWNAEESISLPGALIERDSNTIAKQAWESRELIHINSLQANWEWEHPLVATLHSIMVAPLISGGVLLGIIEVGSLQDWAFSQTDVAAFQQMTNQLAVAVANADTYSQSQRLARNKVKANEIIAHLQQQADVNSILQVTAQELGKALGAKRARIRLGLDVPNPSGD